MRQHRVGGDQGTCPWGADRENGGSGAAYRGCLAGVRVVHHRDAHKEMQKDPKNAVKPGPMWPSGWDIILQTESC